MKDNMSVAFPVVDNTGVDGLPQDTLTGQVANLPPELSCVKNKFIFVMLKVTIKLNLTAINCWILYQSKMTNQKKILF